MWGVLVWKTKIFIKKNLEKMNKKQVIRLNEIQLKQIIFKAVKHVLKESEEDTYFGGGLPEHFLDDDEKPETGDYNLTEQEYNELESIVDKLYNIANSKFGDTDLLYTAAQNIEAFLKNFS
jgi:hypothetical protein